MFLQRSSDRKQVFYSVLSTAAVVTGLHLYFGGMTFRSTVFLLSPLLPYFLVLTFIVFFMDKAIILSREKQNPATLLVVKGLVGISFVSVVLLISFVQPELVQTAVRLMPW